MRDRRLLQHAALNAPSPRRRTAASRALWLGGLSAVFLTTNAWSAHASPQVNVGVVPGVDWRPNSKLAFDGQVAVDVLFGREGDRSFGFGPRLEVGTRAFDDLRTAAGLSLLVPSDPLVVVGTAHGLLQTNNGATHPGLGARLFVGLRPYNYYGWYSAGLGLTLGADHVFGDTSPNLIVGLQLDGMWLSLPFLFLFQTAAH